MTRILHFIGTQLKRLFSARVPLPQSPAVWLMAILSGLGVAGLGYLFGAAVMFYELPSCDFLTKGFAGATAWYERGRSTLPVHTGSSITMTVRVTVDKVEKTYDGFTLYTATDGPRATLLDMRATEVHRWELPFRQAWPLAPHVEDPLPDDHIHWFHCYLYANGDLLAIYHADGDTPFGYGLVKVDKDSKLLWAYPGRVHHDLDVGEDGTIYTLVQKLVSKPSAGLEFLPTPCITGSLVLLTAQGQELETIPLLESFVQSPYAPILASIPKHASIPASISKHATQQNAGSDRPRARSRPWQTVQSDLLHTNSVKVLSRTLAPKFPLFKAGQVLFCLRNFDTIGILDCSTRRVVWAAQGIWQLQHDADFMDNGHLLLYDNYGSAKETRILEYDPLTQAVPWLYANENARSFRARFRGDKQRLPNGNTLIVDPDNRRLFEVTQDKELVWESVLSTSEVQSTLPVLHAINSARRYSAAELTFLNGRSCR
jgi:hypothetical protein